MMYWITVYVDLYVIYINKIDINNSVVMLGGARLPTFTNYF